MALNRRDKYIIYISSIIPMLFSIYAGWKINRLLGGLNLLIVISWISAYRATDFIMQEYNGFTRRTGQIISTITYLTYFVMVVSLLLWNWQLGILFNLMLAFGMVWNLNKNCGHCDYLCPFNKNPQRRYKS